MSPVEKASKKHFPWIILLSFIIAVLLVFFFNDPLTYLKTLLVDKNFEFSAAAYTIILTISVVLSPLSIAPVVPFVAKILGPTATFLLTIIGWNVGSSIAYFIARFGGKHWISKVYPVKSLYDDRYGLRDKPGFIRLMQARFFASQDYFSYYLGLLSSVSYPRFLLVSLLGSVPAAFIFSYSADAIADGDVYTLFVLLFATGLIAFSYLSYRGIARFKKAVHVYTDKASLRAGEIMAVATVLLFLESQDKRYVLRRVDVNNTKRMSARAKRDKAILISQENICPDGVECFFSEEAGKRGNNIPYGTFGSVWKKYGTTVSGSKLIAERLDVSLVSGIDAEEMGVAGELDANFIEQWSLSEILEHNFVDTEITAMSQEDQNESFVEAVDFAKAFIRRAVKKQQDVEENKPTIL